MPSPGNPFVDKTYAQSIALIAERFASREALVFGNQRFTYSDVKAHVDAASARFAALGLKRGERVALWLPNRPEFLWYWLGAAQLGLVVVVLNTRLTLKEMAYQLGQSESCAVLIPGDGAFRPFITEIVSLCPEIMDAKPGEIRAAALPDLRYVIACDPLSERPRGITDWSAPLPLGAPLPPLEQDPDAPALISYSSGTTALPKGALITHCVWRKAYDIGERIDQTPDERLYLCIPLFGSMAMMNGIAPFLARGSSIVLDERFEPGQMLKALEEHRCTATHLLPTMIEQLAEHPALPTTDLSALRIGWVLSDNARILDMASDALGIPGVMTGYGLTETTTVLTRNRWDDPRAIRLATQGYPLPDVELRIADPSTGAELARGEIGEICARSYCIMKGYYKKPDEFARTMTPDGWFKTGDLGVIDATGRLTFKGRAGDSYKSRGFNVSPAEIEAALASHEAVASAAVVGMPHHAHGAVGVAFVVKHPEQTIDEHSLLAWVKPQLSSFKIPARIHFVESLPMTAGTGKVQKFRLREIAAQMTATEAAAS
jgi:acyl-CoA synthetase (AMP-forming)/AMP-acid ligase II